MASRLQRHATTIVIAVVTAAITASITTVAPGMAASGDLARSSPLGVEAPRLLAGVHTVRAAPGAEPTIDKWFNAVNGVEPTLTGERGEYDLNVGFRTASSFVQCSIDTNYVDTRDALCTVSTPFRKIVRVRIWDTGAVESRPDVTGSPRPRNAEFWILVYGS